MNCQFCTIQSAVHLSYKNGSYSAYILTVSINLSHNVIISASASSPHYLFLYEYYYLNQWRLTGAYVPWQLSCDVSRIHSPCVSGFYLLQKLYLTVV